MNDMTYLVGDVGDEQQHVGSNAPVIPESSSCSETPKSWHPEPGTECEARTFHHGEWCKWKPVVVRAYDGNEVWFQCPITRASFTGPVDSMEFRPKFETKHQCYDADVIEVLATELTLIAKQESNRVEYQSGFMAAVNEMFIKANRLRQQAKESSDELEDDQCQ